MVEKQLKWTGSEIGKDRYAAIRNRALELCNSYGLHDLHDDFAQFSAEAIARGRKATMHQLWVDFLREEFGDTRSEKQKELNQLRLEEKKYAQEIDPDMLTASPVVSSDLKHLQNNLEDMERAVFTFVYMYGFSLKEVGDAFGVSESRIGQYVMEIKKKLPKRIKADN